jgi:hypothetical protein
MEHAKTLSGEITFFFFFFFLNTYLQKVHGAKVFACEFASCHLIFSDDDTRVVHELEAHGFNRNRKRAKVKGGVPLMGNLVSCAFVVFCVF